MRALFLLTAALTISGCHHYAPRGFVTRDAIEELESTAVDQLRCEDVKVQPLTLLTRVVQGCGHQRVYAFEPLREQWVLSAVEGR